MRVRQISRPVLGILLLAVFLSTVTQLTCRSGYAADGSKYAHSDSDARFLHHIDLYDADNRKITSESTTPYSSVKTCGRCHDYETISHGWHFNAFDPDAKSGREGEPWIWTDARTGTQLPLSYRDWSHTFDPREIGITAWQMTEKFGGRIPGGSMAAGAVAAVPEVSPSLDASSADGEVIPSPRWKLSGTLDIDCMICHAQSGAYDFNQRREQIEEHNFAWAPTAGLRLGTIDGKVSRIKEGSDPEDDAIKAKLPKVSYNPRRFNSDGTVFMDLIREPSSNACYQCHSNRIVGDKGIEQRWVHDEDVHLRAGMSCADCHRNGIDHHISRGFEGEENPSGTLVQTLSCTGCHLGAQGSDADTISLRAGRLGSPTPMHAGLPPVHFEKLACTACHGGPAPRDEALRLMTSLAHGLGDKGHRDGFELPAIQGPVFTKGASEKIHPHRAVWPAYWATVVDGVAKPIAPEKVYDATRKSLRVRKDFVDELVLPKWSSKDLKEVLGDDRARIPSEEWSDDERQKLEKIQRENGETLFAEKVSAALASLEKELEAEQAVYISGGVVYARGEEPDTLTSIQLASKDDIDMVSWPMAHNVRPSGWSLGIKGCTECHSDGGKIFASTVSPVGPAPNVAEPITMATLQGMDANQRLAWNQLFSGRKTFKYIIFTSLALLLMTLLVGAGAIGAKAMGAGVANVQGQTHPESTTENEVTA
ncbi:hypothetical protein [Planctomycetes bacterium K23_9]|uniref:Cytochrome c-552/4 domain-containing protein n=1 Tax=Stieleria marina TaxID=1930275 RepID=A0A517NZ97_9BACT|nr:hypothetical protein K239x_44640 [Planctomycetes bacterium K23_9]